MSGKPEGFALVTGATGLLGSHIVRRLHSMGWEVRALVRDVNAAGWLRSEGALLVQGNTGDAASLARAAAGSAAIFNCAAEISPVAGWPALERSNIEGTRHAIAAARSAGARLVHASSVAVYGAEGRHRADGERTAEDSPLAALAAGDYYARSKRESERLVLEAHARGDLWACSLRPDVMYGERDRQFIPRVARLLSFGLAPIVGSGESIMPIVHAGNVADAFVRAASSEAAGGRVYNVANDFDLSYLRFLELAEAGMQARIRRVRIRASLAHGFSGVIELALRAGLGRKVPMPTRGTLDFVTRDNPFSSARARAELGWLPLFRPEEMVPASFAWWRQSRTKPR